MNEKKRSALLLAAAGVLALILVLVVCLFSCRKPSVPQVAICFRNSQENSEYCTLLELTLQEAGYQVSVADALNDQTRQTEQISSFAEKEVDLLIVEPVMVSHSQQLAAQVEQAGIPTVFINHEPEAEAMDSWDRLSYVGCQTDQLGTLQGSILLKSPDMGDMNGDGVVSYLIISGPEDDIRAQLQASGCVSALSTTELTLSPVGTQWGEWTLDSGRMICAQALSQYGKDIEVIFCGNDTIAMGALEAIRSGGWQVGEDYYLLGIGGEEQAIQLVQSGSLTGTVSENREGQTQQVLAVVKAMLAGETVEKKYYVNCTAVTEENVETFLPQ